MRKHLPVLAACFIAASVTGFAGAIPLNNSTGDVSFTTETIPAVGTSSLNVMTLGSDTCSTDCALSGTADLLGFFLSWQVQSLNPANATNTNQLFTYTFTPEAGNAGTGSVTSPTATGVAGLTVSDAPDGGGDSATATFLFTNLAQDGAPNGIFVNGFVELAAGAVTLNGPDSGAFMRLLEGAGVIFSGLTNNAASLSAALQVTNCMNDGSPSACIVGADPTGTFSSLTIGTVAPASGVPEPGTLALLGCGLVALMVVRSRSGSSPRRR